MFDRKLLCDIRRSAQSLEAPGTTISGFACRLVRQYGVRAVLRVVDVSALSPLQAGWVKRWIQTNPLPSRRSSFLPL